MIVFDKNVTFESGRYIDKLENKVYQMNIDKNGNLFLTEQPSFSCVELCGDSVNISDLVVSHYNKTKNNFGIMLQGISGMGKSQTIKHVCNKIGTPVVLINKNFEGSKIKEVIDNVNTDCIIVFDEFEKVYSKKEDSETLLSLFDGIDTGSRVMFIVSANEPRDLSKFFFGRPGRFVFNFNFKPLCSNDGLSFIKQKTIINNEPRMLEYLENIDNLSYDICDKISQLINIHGEEVFAKNCRHFNVNPIAHVFKYEVMYNKIVKSLSTATNVDYIYVDFYVGEDNIETNLTQEAKNTIRKLKIGDIAVLSGLDFSNPHEGLEVHVRKEKQSAFEISSVGY